MDVLDGIVYAGNPTSTITVCEVRPLDDYRLWARFNTGEAKIFDFKPLLHASAFSLLVNEEVFRAVYIDYGVTVWNNGDIDIAPEVLYQKGIAVSKADR